MKMCYEIPEARAILDISQWSNSHYLICGIDVPSPFRKRGYGTQLMNEVCKEADSNKVILFLTVASSGEMSDEELMDWYKKFDFISIKKSHLMIRYPK